MNSPLTLVLVGGFLGLYGSLLGLPVAFVAALVLKRPPWRFIRPVLIALAISAAAILFTILIYSADAGVLVLPGVSP
jgi:hypothetical protein